MTGVGHPGTPQRRVTLIAGAGSLLVAALLVAGCDSGAVSQTAPPPPPPVTVATPVVKDIVEWTDITGRFEATAAVNVQAQVGGYLASVHFRDGAIVNAGDLLFTIDRRPYQAALSQAEAAIVSAETRLEFARGELERAEQLQRTGVAAARTLDERQQQFQSAQADIAGARAAAQQARLNLEYAEIRAPIAGRISRRLVTEGNLINANDTLLTTIVSLDPIYFYFDVDERTYLAFVRLGQSGARPSGREVAYEVRLALADEREPTRIGRMDFVDNRIDEATGTMRSRAVFENDDLFLAPGLFGRISIPASGSYRGVLIPDEAVGADLDRRFVYVVDAEGNAQQQVIRLGPRMDGYRIVRQGLTGEETIVVNGIQRVRPGGKVTPQPTTLPPSR